MRDYTKYRKKDEGQNHNPELYDGYDFQYQITQNHRNKKGLLDANPVFQARVSKIINIDSGSPNGVGFVVVARVDQLDAAVQDPKTNVDYSSGQADKEYVLLDHFTPENDKLKQPSVGSLIYVRYSDPHNRLGGVYIEEVSSLVSIGALFEDVREGVSAAGNATIEAAKNTLNSITDGISSLFGGDNKVSTVGEQTQKNTQDANKVNSSIDSLAQETKEALQVLIQKIKNENLPIVLFEALRTPERQRFLYTKGRTTPVVREKGIYEFPGLPTEPQVTSTLNSNHFTGHAADFVLDVQHSYWKSIGYNPKGAWDVSNKTEAIWQRFGQLAKESGFNWGGYWQSFKDYPHIELMESKRRS